MHFLPYLVVFQILLFTALIESDAEGIGGSGFVECIREHIISVNIVVNFMNILLLAYYLFFTSS